MQKENLRPLNPSSGTPYESYASKVLRNNVPLPVFLAAGAVLQGLLFALPIRPIYALLPAVLYLSLRALDTFLITVGLKKNPFLANIIPSKFSASFPQPDGSFVSGATEPICVFILGTKINHPLGPLAPGVRTLGEYADPMFAALDSDRANTGFLGKRMFMDEGGYYNIMYFKSREDVHRFATSKVHRDGMAWWFKVIAKWPHLGIMHELYQVPAGQWENIFSHMEPDLIASTKHLIKTPQGEKFISPVIDASHGKMSFSRGRIGDV